MEKARFVAGNHAIEFMRSANGFMLMAFASLLLALLAMVFHNPFLTLPTSAELGILSLIPAEYWLALILSFTLMLANIGNPKKNYFFMSMMLFILLFVSIESFFLYNPVGTTDAYGHFLRGADMEDSGNPLLSFVPEWYPNGYFGSFLFTKVMVELLGLKNTATVPLISIFRMLAPLFFFGCMYLMFSKIATMTKARTMMIVMIMGIPYFQFHYSPHAFGLIIMAVLLYTILVPAENPVKNYLMQILLFTFLMISHGPTTLYIGFAYGAAIFLHHALKSSKDERENINICMPAAAYFVIGAIMFNPIILKIINVTISDFGMFSGTANSMGMALDSGQLFSYGNYGIMGLERLGGHYMLAEFIRLGVLGLFLLICLMGLLRMFTKKEFGGINVFIIGGIIAAGVFLVGNILYASLNFGDRSFLYMGLGGILIGLYIMPNDFLERIKGLKLADKNAIASIFIIVILMTPAVGALAYHYNQGVYFTAPQNRERYLFMPEHTDVAVIYCYWENHGIFLKNRAFEVKTFDNLDTRTLAEFNPEAPFLYPEGTFVTISESTEWYYTLEERIDEYDAIINYCDQHMNRVYSSPGNVVWYIDL